MWVGIGLGSAGIENSVVVRDEIEVTGEVEGKADVEAIELVVIVDKVLLEMAVFVDLTDDEIAVETIEADSVEVAEVIGRVVEVTLAEFSDEVTSIQVEVGSAVLDAAMVCLGMSIVRLIEGY